VSPFFPFFTQNYLKKRKNTIFVALGGHKSKIERDSNATNYPRIHCLRLLDIIGVKNEEKKDLKKDFNMWQIIILTNSKR
jgi:hypothetical protein